MKYYFNDGLRNRSRSCKYAILYAGKCFSFSEAQKQNLAIFRSLKWTKNGKWSSTDWEVTTNSAKLIVCVEPFSGWNDNVADCIKYVQSCQDPLSGLNYVQHEKVEITSEEALIFLKYAFPELMRKLTDLENKEQELI